MKIAEFRAFCPHEIGDALIVRIIDKTCKIPYLSTQDDFCTITNIMCLHSLKDQTVQFMYELDGSEKYVLYMKIDANEYLYGADGRGQISQIISTVEKGKSARQL